MENHSFVVFLSVPPNNPNSPTPRDYLLRVRGYLRRVIGSVAHHQKLEIDAFPKTGAELVAYWQNEGVVNSQPNIADGQASARKLRNEAQKRSRDQDPRIVN